MLRSLITNDSSKKQLEIFPRNYKDIRHISILKKDKLYLHSTDTKKLGKICGFLYARQDICAYIHM